MRLVSPPARSTATAASRRRRPAASAATATTSTPQAASAPAAGDRAAAAVVTTTTPGSGRSPSDEPRGRRQPQARVEHDARERPARPRGRQQQRVVGERRADADDHRVVQPPQPPRLGALGRARDPLRAALCRGDPAVERGRRLEQDERAVEPGRGQERLVQPLRLGRQHADARLDPRRPQQREPPPVDERERVAHGCDDARNARVAHERRARGRAAVVRARLERDVERRAARASPGLLQRRHLGVRTSGPRVETLAHDAAAADDDAADDGVGVRLAEPRAASASAQAHEEEVALRRPARGAPARHATPPAATRRTPRRRTAGGRRPSRPRRRSGSGPRARGRPRPRSRPSRSRRAS